MHYLIGYKEPTNPVRYLLVNEQGNLIIGSLDMNHIRQQATYREISLEEISMDIPEQLLSYFQSVYGPKEYIRRLEEHEYSLK